MVADVHPDQRTAAGAVDAAFTPDLATDRIVLRLGPNAPNMAAGGAHLDAGPVTIDGRPAPTTQPDPTTLVVAAPLAAGRTVAVHVPWPLRIAGAVEERVAAAGGAVRLGSFVPLIAWEPGVGWATDPATTAKGEAAMTPAADFDLDLTVPPGFDVLATGVQDRPGHWSAPAVPDLGVSVGHFVEATAVARRNLPNPVTVTVAVQAGLSEDPHTRLAKIVSSLEHYSARFGPYPWPSYSVAVTPALTGGIEFPMHVMAGPGSEGRSTSHEVGHQWFYGLVENDQGRDPWLDEGLASWAETIQEGTLESFVSRSVPVDGRGQLGRPMTYWSAHPSSYYTSVYVQAVQALAALGPVDLVDCTLAAYVNAHAFRVARPADLISALTAVFPKAPATLARFGASP